MFRSQIAVAIYNALMSDISVAEGYGTAVAQENRQGTVLCSYPEMVIALRFMEDRGLNISKQCCKQITPQALVGANSIIMMSEPEFIPEWLLSYKYEFWEVPNPTHHTEKIVEDTHALLYEKILDFLLVS